MGDWNDPRFLVRLARDILAAADQATLLVTEPVPASERATLLPDDGGTPRLWCAPGSVVVIAARRRRPAILTVRGTAPGAAPGGTPVTLTLAGRLEHRGTGTDGGEPGDVVAVTLARVSIDVGRDPDVTSHPVGLDAYAGGRPDPIAEYATRVLAHTNARHQNELRGYVSCRFALPLAAVAGAMLSQLDRHGATVRWVDAEGAHSATVAFDRAAGCPTELAALLRERLSAPGPA